MGIRLAPARLVLLAFLTSCTSAPELVPGAAVVALEGATLIDGRGGDPVENAAIVMDGARIVRIGVVGDFDYPDGEVVDVSGRFIIPGLINTHAHMFEEFPSILLAFGITTVRNPGSGADEGVSGASLGVSLREALSNGEVVGPRMLTAGRIINNSGRFSPQPGGARGQDVGSAGNYAEVRSEADIRREIGAQVDAGYDFVKLYLGIDSALLQAGVEEAHARGVRAIGHLEVTSWTAAANAGIDGLMHSCSEGPTWELTGGEVAASWAQSLRDWAASVDLVSFEEAPWKELLTALVTNGTEVNPTLSTMEALYWADSSADLRGNQPAFAPPGFVDRWTSKWASQANFMAAQGFDASDHAALRDAFSSCLKMTRAMYEAGVLLTAGDDVGGWMTPGTSFHRELRLLSEAGIPNMGVLRVATANGATALGLADHLGTLEPGKQADLVVLASNPLVDISNTRTIQAIYKGGVRFEPADLLNGVR